MMKIQLLTLSSLFFLSACSVTIDSTEVIQKYRKFPRKDGVRAALIEEEILPVFHKEAPYQLEAISFAKGCFSKASNADEANQCTKKLVSKFGSEFDFNDFKSWEKDDKEKMMRFLDHNEAALECYMKSKKADDIIPCKDSIEPDF